MTHLLSSTVITYPEGTAPPTIDVSDGMRYTPSAGENIEVVLWVRYPDYDFIFGVPEKDNPKHEKEIGFFQYRDTRRKAVVEGFYLDFQEVREMLQGFSSILQRSQENSPHLWKPQN